jgi:hypothetical protein
MTWTFYDNFKRLQLSANAVNFGAAGDTLKMMLCSSAYAQNQTTDAFVSDVSRAVTEVRGGGYPAGGIALASKTATVSAHALTVDCGDVLVPQDAAGFTNARIAVLYKSTGVEATSPLIAFYVLAEDKNNVAADLPMKTPTGIFTVPAAPSAWPGGLHLYDSFLARQFGGVGAPIDLLVDPLKGMLATTAYVPDLTTHTVLADVSPEVSGNPYTAGGLTLTGRTLGVTAHVARFAADDLSWAPDAVNGFANAGCLVLYKSTGVAATSPLIGCFNLRESIPAPNPIGNTVGSYPFSVRCSQGLLAL